MVDLLPIVGPEEVARHASWCLPESHLLRSLLDHEVEGVVHQVMFAEELAVGLEDLLEPTLILFAHVEDAFVYLAQALVHFNEIRIFQYVLINWQFNFWLVLILFLLENGQCHLLLYVLSLVIDGALHVEPYAPGYETAFEVKLVLHFLFVQKVGSVLHHYEFKGRKIG